MALRDLTDKQIVRLYQRIYDRLKDGMDGDPYGIDVPTIAIVKPACFRAYRDVGAEGRRRQQDGTWTL